MRNEQYYVYSSFLLFSIQEKSIITYISLHNIAHRNAQTLNSANRAIQAAQNFIENHLAVHVTQLLTAIFTFLWQSRILIESNFRRFSPRILGNLLVVAQQSIEMQVSPAKVLSTLLTNGLILTQTREKTEANSTDHRTTMVGVRFWRPIRPLRNG